MVLPGGAALVRSFVLTSSGLVIRTTWTRRCTPCSRGQPPAFPGRHCT